MKALWFLTAIPAFFLGALFGMVLLGILPTIALDAFISDFHYSYTPRRWIEIAGMFGASFGTVMSFIFSVMKVVE